MDETKETVQLSKEDFDKLSSLPDVVNNLVAEIQQERKAKQTAEAERDALIVEKNTKPPADVTPQQATPEDPTVIVERLLAKKDQEAAKAAREAAEAKFRETNKDFHPDNDPGGLKFAAFQRVLAKLNDSGARTVEDFSALYDDALALMNRQSPVKEVTYTPYAHTPSESGSPHQQDPNGLSAKEKRIIQGIGWTEERYLKIKKSRPEYIKKLLASSND